MQPICYSSWAKVFVDFETMALGFKSVPKQMIDLQWNQKLFAYKLPASNVVSTHLEVTKYVAMLELMNNSEMTDIQHTDQMFHWETNTAQVSNVTNAQLMYKYHAMDVTSKIDFWISKNKKWSSVQYIPFKLTEDES